MKKKSLITMLVSLSLVATVGVGATLAYFTSTTDTLTNVFTVGEGIQVDLMEEAARNTTSVKTIINASDSETTGFDYGEIMPGFNAVKAPYVTKTSNSNDSYIFMKVVGIDDLEYVDGSPTGFLVSGFDEDWKIQDDITTRDGIYYYDGTFTNNATDKIFTTLTYTADGQPVLDAKEMNITLEVCAVQKDNVTLDQALELAKAEFTE